MMRWHAIRKWIANKWPWISKETMAAKIFLAVADERRRGREELKKYRQVDLAEEREKLSVLVAMLTRIERENQSAGWVDPRTQVIIRTTVDGRMFYGIDSSLRAILAEECGRHVEHQLRNVYVIAAQFEQERLRNA